MPAPQSHLSHSSPPAVLSQKQQRQQPHQQQQSQKPAPPSHQNSLSVYHRGVATSATQQILSPPQHPLHRALPHQAPTQLFTLQQPQLHQQQSGGAGNQFAIPPSPAPSSSYPLRSSPSSDEDSAYSSMKEDTPPTVFPSTSDALSPPGTFSATPTHHFIPPQLPLSAIPDLQAIKLFLDTTLKFAGDLQFRILGVPTQNARSRVETQIKICLQLVSMPKGEKVSHWSYLKLPEHAVTRDKVKRGVVQDFLQLPPNSVLTLEARVVCASDPTRTVQLCTSCAQRERKRSRKTAEEDAEDFPGQQIDRTLLFSCPGHVDFSSGDTILPTRIACYSRHQNEKIGFCVYFVGRDASGNAVATGLTPPVLITDDHKAGKPKAQKRTRDDVFKPELPVSTPASSNPPVKAEPQCSLPPDDNMSTSLFASPMSPGSIALSNFIKDDMMTAGMSPTPSSSRRSPTAPMLQQNLSSSSTFEDAARSNPVSTVQGALGIYDTFMFDDSFASGGDESERPAKRAMMSLGGDEFNHAVAENLLAALGGEEFDGGSLNAFEAMIASSTAAEKNATPHLQQRQMALEGLFSDFATSPLNAETPSLTSGLTTQVPPTTASPAPTTPTPTIHRIIPSSGPMTGGIEVTLLGSNLHQNLTVLFGGVPAASSHSWGSGSTLVCILPPSSTPGPVPVTFKEHPLTSITAIGEVVVFTYRDETERALMELALQVVGLKMTGRLEDARDVAMRIVSDTANGGVGSGTASLNGSRRSWNASSPEAIASMMQLVRRMFGLAADLMSWSDLECTITDLLMSLEFSETLEVESNESAQPSHLDVRTKTGRHSLLHLACMMKMTALVKYLVGCDDIDLDARDAWGFTPLHYAAWSGNRGLCVQLVQAGASLLLSSRDGITVGHLAIKAGMNLVELVRTCFPAPGLPLVNQRSMSLTLVRVEENDDEALSYDAEYEFDDDEEETEAFKFTPFFGQIAGDKSHMSELRLVDEPQVANVVSAKTIVSRDAVASRPMRSVSSNVLSSYHSSPFATPLKPPTTESGSIRRSGSLPLFPDPAHELLSAVLEAAKPVNFAEFSNLKQLRNESKTGVSDMGSESDKKVSSSKKAHGSWLPIGPYMAIPQLLFAFPYMLPALPSVSDFASVSVPGMKLLTDLLSFVTDVVLRQGTAERGSSLDFEKSPSQPTSPLTTANHPLSTPVSPLLTADAILGTAPLPPLLDLSLSRSSTLAGSVDPTSSDSRASLDTLHSDDPIDDLLPPPPASFLATLPPCTCPPPSASDQHATTSTSDTSCRHHALLRAHAESQKRKRDRAVALFWAPLLLLMVALALFRVFVSNEEMDRIVDRVVVVNVEVVAYVRDTVRGLRHGAAGFGGGGDTGVGVVGDGHRWWQGGGGLDGSWWGIGGGGPAAVGVVG